MDTAARGIGTPRGGAEWAVVATLTCGGFLATFDLNAVAFSLPKLVVVFGVPSSVVAWLIIAYAMAAGGLFIIAGKIADIFGFERVFRAGCLCLLVGAVIAALSVDFEMLIVARIVQGAGMALVLSTSPAVLASIFPGPDQDRVIAFYVSAVTSGIIAGPVAGGLVDAALGWRWVFGVIAVLSLALSVLAFFALPVSRRTVQGRLGAALVSFDYPGALLLFWTVALGIVALYLGPSRGWGTPLPLTALGIAGACLCGFVVREHLASDTLFDLHLLHTRRFLLSSLLCAAVMMVYNSICILVPFYLVVVRHHSLWVAGLFLAGGVVPILLLGPFAMRLPAAEGRYRVRLGAALGILGGVVCLLLLDADAGTAMTVVGIGLVVAGVAVLVPPLQAAALRATPLSERASAAGLLMTMRNLGCIIGAGAAQSVMGEAVAIEAVHIDGSVGEPGVRAAVLGGIQNALTFSLAVAAAMVVMVALLREPRRTRRPSGSPPDEEHESGTDLLRRAMVASSFAPAPSPLLPLGTAAGERRGADEAASLAQTPEEPNPRSDRSVGERS